MQRLRSAHVARLEALVVGVEADAVAKQGPGLDLGVAERDFTLTGDATDLRTGAINDLVVLKASWATEAVAAKRRIYVDLGANLYESSIGNWFRASYPDAGTYKVYAFEAERKYDDSYAGHPDVTLLHYAVSTANGTVPWGHAAKKGGRTRIR